VASTHYKHNLLMLSGDSSIAQGQQGAFYEMLRRFAPYWARVDILTPRGDSAQARTLHDNVCVHPSPWHRALQPLFIRQQGGRLLAERGYGLVVSHDFGFFYNGIGACWLLHDRNLALPLVSEIHHVEGYPQAVTWREKAWRAAAMRYLPFVGRRAAAIRVVNQREVPDLLRRLGIPDEKIRVLPSLYLDLSVFRPADSHICYDVLFVGRLAANKGVLTLLQAVQQVQQTHPQVKLAIRGAGPLRAQIEQFMQAHGLTQNVQFLPRADTAQDMAQLYRQAKMLVCASTVEGNPRVTIEAMACTVPVISTPVGVMPDVLRDGDNGYLFQWDADELAAKIRTLLDDEALRVRMGKAGRDAVQRFEADAMIRQYALAYHEIAANDD
jgi:glycosyltransferase involved in cell wall biosynthesis